MVKREWVEFTDPQNEGERLAIDLAHISTVRKLGNGSIVVSDGVTYQFERISYDSMLQRVQFFRDTPTLNPTIHELLNHELGMY